MHTPIHYQNDIANAERSAATFSGEARKLLLQQSKLYDKVNHLYYANRGAPNAIQKKKPTWPQSPKAVTEKVHGLLGQLKGRRP